MTTRSPDIDAPVIGEIEHVPYTDGHPLANAVSIVIPAYNEAAHVAAEIRSVREVMKRTGWEFEIIVVDDGSSDDTSVNAAATGVRVIRHPRNRGYGAALKRGIAASSYDWILITDADGTYPADSIPDLLARAAAPGAEREAFAPAFALPNLTGDTVRLADYAGKVTLVNFWASWCDPCREEFPHMAELYREFARTTFEIAAISDDVDRGKMLGFVREFRPPFPILVGGGRMKQRYHYRGLPYSVVLDRQGRVVERIFGFGGAAEFQRLRETIAKEARAP